MWSILNPVKKQIYLAIFLAGLAVFANLLVLASLAWSVQALLSHPEQMPYALLSIALLSTMCAYVLRITAFNQSHYASFRLENHLRKQLAEHLAKVPLGYVENMGSGSLAKILMQDVKALHIFVADSTPLYARAYVSPVLTFMLLWWLDWRLSLATVAVLCLGLWLVFNAFSSSQALMQQYNQASENVSKAVVEYVQAMPVVRSFSTAEKSFERYQHALNRYKQVVLQWYRRTGILARLAQLIVSPLPTLTTLLWLGVWLLNQESLNLHHYLMVLLISAGMTESLLPLSSLKHLIGKTEMSVKRIQEVLAEPILPMTTQPKYPQDNSVVFDQVDFRYQQHSPLVLQQVSFTLKPNGITAIVGASGAGKSTVAKLIPRFWDVTSGSIRIGGVDVRHLSQETLMQQVAFVLQDNFLFSGSIADNIRLGMPNVSEQEIIQAAKAAQAHSFIMQLPQAYATPVGERGAFLSGGQRQRITIARAILQNKPILILDEATAFTDPNNELALAQALSALIKGKTVLIIAHRLNSICTADQILVFEKGYLKEQGQHQDLLAQHGIYAHLWQQQQQVENWLITGENHG